jgi:hypothetical protein
VKLSLFSDYIRRNANFYKERNNNNNNEEKSMEIAEINGETYVKKSSVQGPLSIVRTFSAGVHVGEFVEQDGTVVKLKNARRIWRWQGANTLNEIALHGVNRSEYTRISEIVPEIVLTESIEIIPVTDGVDLEPVWND